MKKKGITVLIGILSASVILTMTAVYTKTVQNSIRSSILANLSELTAHDVKTVESHISRSWNDLEHIAERMNHYKFESVEEAQAFLTMERSASLFSVLYLLDEQGEAYTSNLIRLSADEHDFVKSLENSDTPHFVVRNREYRSESDENLAYLLYGVELRKPIKIADVTVHAVIGQAKITDIREQLIIESYSGLGNSRIVDAEGNYIVLPLSYATSNPFFNIWDAISSERYSIESEKIERSREKFNNQEEFSLNYEDPRQGNVSLIFQPMDIIGVNGWYFVTQVSEQLFRNQSSELIYLNIVQVLLVTASLIALLYLLMIGRSRAMKAEATAAARTEFLSTMSHEIRTPLNGIISLSHQMREHLNEPGRLHGYLSKLTETSEYLVSLVSDILDMNKIQAGKMVCELSATDLTSIVNTVADMQQESLSEKEIHFVQDVQIEYPYLVTDKLHLKQVLMNLLSNASKFTEPGGTITMKLRQKPQNGTVLTTISVTDTGCGISPEFQAVIFDSFTQERNKMSGSTKGTGLGLSISAKFMEQIGGSLSVYSVPGQGSTFTAVFVSDIVHDPDVIANLTQDSREIVSLDGVGILIVEDNLLNGELLQEILTETGARTDWVTDGEQAIRQIKVQPPETYQVVLMDIRMPGINGFEAARAIRSINRPDLKHLIIFACTADSLTDTRENTLRSGMDGFLSKPVDIDELLKKINDLKR